MTELAAHLPERFFYEQPQPSFWMTPILNNGQVVDFEYSYCNNEFYSYLGLTKTEILGQRLFTSPILSKDVKNNLFEEMLHVLNSNERISAKFYNSVVNKHFSYIRTKVGNGVLTVLHDRTEEMNMLHQISEQKNLLDNILKHSSNGISVGNAIRSESGEIIDIGTVIVNDAAAHLTGLDKQAYLSKTGSQLDPNFINSEYFKQCVHCFETGESFITQYYLESAERWLEVSVSRIDSNRQIYIFTDVTTVKKSQLLLEKTIEELSRSNQSLEEFAHAASHDLKEPVRKVHTFAGRLKTSLKDKMNDFENSLFERLENSTIRMQKLIDDLLDYSLINHDNQLLEKVDLNIILQWVISDLEIEIEDRNAEIQADSLPTIPGYRRQLQQLFQNLLTNALKYSNQDVPPLIRIQSSMIKGSEQPVHILPGEFDKEYVLLKVMDNGIGFEQAYAENIFRMFQRLHGKSEYEGTGIGLAIAKKVAINHNGYIWAEGETGKGAVFYIALPAAME